MASILESLFGGQSAPGSTDIMSALRRPQAQQGAGDAFASSLRDMLAGMSMGSTPNESMAYAGKMMATRGSQRDKENKLRSQQNETVNWLTGKGVDASTAGYLARDPAALRAWFGEYQQGQKPKWQIHEFSDGKYMVDMNDPERRQLIDAKPAAAPKVEVDPVSGENRQWDADKRAWVPMRIEGGAPAAQADQAAPALAIPPPPPGADPKKWRETFTKEAAEAQSRTQANLPTALATADRTIQEIDELIEHPGLSSITGPLDQYRPSFLLGAKGNDALARYKQLEGRAFLQAFETLKGGGQITEVEGNKAQSAMVRMQRAQDDKDFKRALTDFRDAVQAGAQKLREKAGVATPAAASGMPPPPPGFQVVR